MFSQLPKKKKKKLLAVREDGRVYSPSLRTRGGGAGCAFRPPRVVFDLGLRVFKNILSLLAKFREKSQREQGKITQDSVVTVVLAKVAY